MTGDELICKNECHDVLARFCQALDSGASAAAADLFAVLIAPNGEKITGRRIAAFLRAPPKSVFTRHVLTNVLVTPQAKTRLAQRPTSWCIAPSAGTRTQRRGFCQRRHNWLIDFTKSPEGWRIARYTAKLAPEVER